jgi:4-coumarate--CoA ligase (photoactive yellow protein activation family)
LQVLLGEEKDTDRIAQLIIGHIADNLGHELCFRTSGSTGEPLLHKHSLFALRAEIMAFAQQAGPIKRVVSVVPRYHLYGCSFAFLLPLILKIPVLQVPLLSEAGLTDELSDGDLLVAFPLFGLHLCALKRPFAHTINMLTSTGPCPPRVFDELRALGINSLYEIYGSSETGAVGLRNYYKDYFKLLTHWRKYDDHTLLRKVFDSGYERIALPDNVFWADKHSFRLIDRIDKAVQVGGSNVYPRQIAAIIESHPAVKLCRVRLMDEEEGHRLKAFVVPREMLSATSGLTAHELKVWCQQRLTPAQRPRSFVFGDKLPVTKLGKDANWSIKQR